MLSVAAIALSTLFLGDRPGGFVHGHMLIADAWLQHGRRIVLTGDQYSAAALQVAYFAVMGGRICARPGVRLHYHGSCNRVTRTCKGDPNRWITRRPGDVGIPTCDGAKP
jgi:hypothetical protein